MNQVLGETSSANSLAVRVGFWSSVIILVSGLGLVGGILASAFYLPTALTTEWRGIEPYADAYRATGGVITSLSFLASLISCPAYVTQLASIHSANQGFDRRRAKIGLVFAVAFATLAGLNYLVQLTIVRTGILSGQTAGLAWLVFQNPGSLMLAVDIVGWFFLGLAFLSAVPLFITGRLNRAIRYVLVANAFVGAALLAGFAFGSPAIGLVFLTTMSALLTCADVLLIIFFKKLM